MLLGLLFLGFSGPKPALVFLLKHCGFPASPCVSLGAAQCCVPPPQSPSLPPSPRPPQSLCLLLPLPVDICLGKGTREVAQAWPPSTVSTWAQKTHHFGTANPNPAPVTLAKPSARCSCDVGVYKSGDEADLRAKSAHLLWEGLLPSR